MDFDQTVLALRARIQTIGGFDRDDPETGQLVVSGWAFDGEGRDVPATVRDSTGEVREIAGWTIEELHLIAHGLPCLESGCYL